MFVSLRGMLRNRDRNRDLTTLQNLIPNNTKTLNLELNCLFNISRTYELDEWSDSQLIQLFSVIPPTVEKLILRQNATETLDLRKLILILNHLPKTIQCLDLSDNLLGDLLQKDIIRIITNIPLNVNQLIISNSAFNSVSFIHNKNNLVEIFQALPRNVHTLTLSLSDLPNDKITLLSLAQGLHIHKLTLVDVDNDRKYQVQLMTDNLRKYPMVVDAYHQLMTLTILPKSIVHEIVSHFLEEEEKLRVYNILDSIFSNQTTMSSEHKIDNCAAIKLV